MNLVYKKRNNVRISNKELELLEVINNLGPSSSQKIHEFLNAKFELLFVMRSMHSLVEKGFLKPIIINKKQLYKTVSNYVYIKSYLNDENA